MAKSTRRHACIRNIHFYLRFSEAMNAFLKFGQENGFYLTLSAEKSSFTQQNQREIIGQERNTTFTACLIELKI